MNQKDCIKKLKEFRKLLDEWNNIEFQSGNRVPIRTKINKNINIVNSILTASKCLKLFTLGPPPSIGGYIMKNINPFDVIFDPPYGFDPVESIIDMIDCAIGVIENDKNFAIDINKERINDIEKVNSIEDKSNKIFIVHGHDVEMKETVARFLQNLDLEPVILHEELNKGLTIIEKFEENSNVPFAIVLLSPDDVGNSKEKKNILLKRARQNVIFELGYFFGKLGRSKVGVLLKDDVEKPSDYDGIIYIAFDAHGGWKTSLAKELRNSGMSIDMNKI